MPWTLLMPTQISSPFLHSARIQPSLDNHVTSWEAMLTCYHSRRSCQRGVIRNQRESRTRGLSPLALLFFWFCGQDYGSASWPAMRASWAVGRCDAGRRRQKDVYVSNAMWKDIAVLCCMGALLLFCFKHIAHFTNWRLMATLHWARWFFSTVFAHSMSLCHILVILTVFLTFFYYYFICYGDL